MNEKKEKQNRKVTLFAILLSLVSLGVLVFGFLVVSSDKVVMLQSISNLYSKMSNSFDNDFVLFNKIAESNNNGVLTKNTVILGKDKYNINVNYIENADISTIDLGISYKEASLNSNIAFSNDKLYVYINEITPTYYYDNNMKYKHKMLFKSLSENDCDKLLSIAKDVINNAINNDSIKKEKVTVVYNGKDKKVNKLTYNITGQDLKDIIKNSFSEIKKDKTLYKNISKLFSNKSLNDYVNNYLKYLDGKETEEIFSYSTYYYGFNKIIKYELYSAIDNVMFTYVEDLTKENINITRNEENILNVVINDDKKSFSFEGNISYLLEKIGVLENETTKLLKNNFSGSYKDNTFEFVINGDDTFKLRLAFNNAIDNSYKYNTSLKGFKLVDGEEKELFTIESEIEFVFDKKIEESLEDSIDYNTLLEEEQNTINEKITTNPIYQIINDNLLKEEDI